MKRWMSSTMLSAAIIVASNFSAAQSSWQSANGPYQGFVYSQALDSDGNLFAGTGGHGVYVVEKLNGSTWQERNAGLITSAIYTIAISSDQIVFAGTDDGIYRSTDRGEHWVQASNGLKNTFINSIVAGPNGAIFAATGGGGVFRSQDKGGSWAQVNNGLDAAVVLSLAIDNAGNLFAGTDGNGVFRSVNGGNSWECVSEGLTNRAVVSLAFDKGGALYGGTRGNGIFRSTNYGDRWLPAGNGMAATSVYAIACNIDGDLFAGTDGGVFLSRDSGSSWNPVNAGLSNMVVLSFAVSSHTLFAGTGGSGVFRLQ